jgi:hypothetical protein
MIFDDDSISDEQEPWMELLKRGVFPESDPDIEPRGYMVQSEWQTMLEEAIESKASSNWFSWLHLGVMRYYAKNRDGARKAWEMSLECEVTPWARRNLAVLAREDGKSYEAVDLYVAACRIRPSLLPLLSECGTTAMETGRPDVWLDLLEAVPDSARANGRIRLIEARAALAVNDFERVERLFREGIVVDDLREGERSLSQLWFDFHERRLSTTEGIPIDDELRARVRRDYPVPKELDFRMSGDG